MVVLKLHVAPGERWVSLDVRSHPAFRARIEYRNVIHKSPLAICVRDLTPDATEDEYFPVWYRLHRVRCVRPAWHVHLSLINLKQESRALVSFVRDSQSYWCGTKCPKNEAASDNIAKVLHIYLHGSRLNNNTTNYITNYGKMPRNRGSTHRPLSPQSTQGDPLPCQEHTCP